VIDSEEITVTDLRRREGSYSARLALVACVLVEIVGLALWVMLARREWFRTDEWDFLAGRTAGNVGDLFRDHALLLCRASGGDWHPGADWPA
jgi:hypothetical protein